MTFSSTRSALGESLQALVPPESGKSGIFLLSDALDAFAARVRLADAAEQTLDVQYYIWHNDMSGTLLFDALRRAADRGVRVRLLLDDNNTVGLDPVLAELTTHEHISVRLFNPFKFRRWRSLGYLTDFARLNRRMHNKAFIADGRVTIIGGRNVGDEYFGASRDVMFVDLDVLAVGPIVDDVARDFELYWQSESAHAAERVLVRVEAHVIADVASAARRIALESKTRGFTDALAESTCIDDLLAGRLELEWAATRLVSDDPAKGLGRAAARNFLWERLKRILNAPTRELYLISPYFVPTATGTKFFTALAKQGVKATVLTNSLEATDVAAVHAGYAKRRKTLLEAGITLYEIKRSAAPPPPPRNRRRMRKLRGSSSSSLHAKTFAVDGTRVFIGSYNFDPRSARLNTEIGVVIDSPAMAQVMADVFANRIPSRAYRVRVAESGALEWIEQTDAGEVVHAKEPGATWWRRVVVWVMSALPVEWLL